MPNQSLSGKWREIKFRAWDDETNEIVYPHEIDFNLGWAYYTDSKEEIQRAPIKYLMQYTGLKDKNGKESFENDIIKYKDDSGKEQIGTIEWAECSTGFYFKSINGDDEGNQDGDMGRLFEIIGNIFDNPDLLKEER